MARVSKTDYEKYLNDLGDDLGDTLSELKMNGGRMPNRSKYGTWMRKNDPIAFNVGFGEYEQFMVLKKKNKTIGRYGSKDESEESGIKRKLRGVHEFVWGSLKSEPLDIGTFGKNTKLSTKSSPQTETVRRVYNPVTGRYYAIKERSSAYPGAGQIKGIWSKDKGE